MYMYVHDKQSKANPEQSVIFDENVHGGLVGRAPAW